MKRKYKIDINEYCYRPKWSSVTDTQTIEMYKQWFGLKEEMDFLFVEWDDEKTAMAYGGRNPVTFMPSFVKKIINVDAYNKTYVVIYRRPKEGYKYPDLK